MTALIDLRPQDLAIVRSILMAALPAGTEAWIFGSRANGRTRRSSDLDLAIDVGRALARSELHRLADAFEDSDLPFTVDIVDLSVVERRFREAIERDGMSPILPSPIASGP